MGAKRHVVTPAKRRRYTQEDVTLGIGLVKSGQSLTAASNESGVPRKTLHDLVKGNREKTSRPGPGYALGNMERSLANYVKYMSQRAHPLTRKGLQFFALRLFKKSKAKSKVLFNMVRGPSFKWCRQFMKRHGLSYRKPEPISKGKSSVTQSTVDNYFTLLGDTLTNLDLSEKPAQIYNMDEVGWGSTNKESSKVIFEIGTRHPIQQDVQVMDHVSVVMAGNAAGKTVPPFLIYKKCLPKQGTDNLPDSWQVHSTESGFINRHLFNEWLKNSFIPNCGRARPVLLLMDNHSSHLSPEAIDTAVSNQIELVCLPPNTTPWAQPLDRVFQHLRRAVEHTARTLRLIDSNFVLNKAKFGLALKYALPRSLTAERLIEAFRSCGISPLDPSAIDRSYIGINDPPLAPESSSTGETSDTEAQANPLAELGIIDAELAEILIPPSIKSQPRPKQNKNARNLTNLTNTDCITQPHARDTALEPSTDCQIPIIQRKEPSLLAPKRFTCKICKTRGLKSDEENGITWVGCDRFPECSSWCHYHCLSRDQQTDVDFSLVTDSAWYCCDTSGQPAQAFGGTEPLRENQDTPSEPERKICEICMLEEFVTLSGEPDVCDWIPCARECGRVFHYHCLPERLLQQIDSFIGKLVCNRCSEE